MFFDIVLAKYSASPRKAVHLTMIASNGLVNNSYSTIIQNVITLDELFI